MLLGISARARRSRKIRRQAVDGKLKQTLRFAHVLEVMFTQIPKPDTGERPVTTIVAYAVGKRRRQQYLTTVAEGRYARGLVHIHTHVAFIGSLGPADVHTDADSDRRLTEPIGCRQFALHCRRGSNAGLRLRKGDEKRISLGIDLCAVKTRGDRTHDVPMALQQPRVHFCPHPAKQPGAAFDIGQHEGDITLG